MIDSRPQMLRRSQFYLLIALLLFSSMLHADPQNTDPAQQSSLSFAIEGEVLASLERKLDEDQFNAVVEHFADQKPTIAQIISWMTASAIPVEIVESSGNELKAYAILVDGVRQTQSIITQLAQSQIELNLQTNAFELAQSEKEKKSLGEKVRLLKDQLEKQRLKLASMLTHVRYEDAERLDGVFEILTYSDKQIEQSGFYIREHLRLNKKLETLQTIRLSIKVIGREIQTIKKTYLKASTPQEKGELDSMLKELSARKNALELNFSNVSSELDHAEIFSDKEVKINLQADLIEMFSPILNEVKAISDKPRRMEAMKKDLADYHAKLEKITLALGNIERASHHNTDPELKKKLIELTGYWQQKNREFTSLHESTQRKVDAEIAKEVPIGTAISEAISSFFKERGKHLFFAILAFILIYMLFQLFQRLFYKYNPFRKNDAYMVWANLTDLAFSVLTFVAAIGAMLIVLYLSGDWLILSMVGLIFIGLAWAARNALPSYVEQIKLLLNFGPVRQDELVVINGLPWKVESIGIYSYFVNPLLTGGIIRLPIQDLIGMRSRPFDQRERWFPCQEGDYILLDGKQWRQIHLQTPDEVQFKWYDMIERMPTQNFIGKNLFNISTTPFWAGGSFNIAYQHRHLARNEITKQLCDFVEAFAKKRVYGEHLMYTWVEFGQCGENSLEFMVWLQLSSKAAQHYDRVMIDINQVSLDAANHYEWEILRFQPIDVHMASPKNFSPQAVGVDA